MKNIIASILAVTCLSGCAFNTAYYSPDEFFVEPSDGEFEVIELTAADDIVIKHYLFKTSQTPKATLFVLQEREASVASWYEIIKPIINKGYQVFMMEYRRPGDTEIETPHFKIVSDTVKAINYLALRTDVNQLPIALLGQSYGGQPAIYAAHIKSNVIDALILEGAFTSFSEQAAYSSHDYLRTLVGKLVPDVYSGIELIKHVKLPTLIIHSTEDKAVPFSMGEALKNASGDPDVELWEIDGKHLDGLIQRPAEYAEKIQQLLKPDLKTE